MSLDWEAFKQAQYHYVTKERAPCSDGYMNQCALRVCNALIDAGWPFNSPSQPYTETRFGPLCTHGRARGARSLADYLEVYLTAPLKFGRPFHPETGEQAPQTGRFEQSEDGSYEFFPTLEWLWQRGVKNEEKIRGIIFFTGPTHIDGFDMWNIDYTTGGHTDARYGIIGEEYLGGPEIRVFLV